MSRPMTNSAGARGTFISDFLASIVVFMVALPLCIGIAQASGLPPEAGIVTGIVGGILVGALSGSPLQVSGPAAGLIVLVFDFLSDARTEYPTANPVALLGIALAIAGGLQILAGIFRIGQWFRAVSPAVVEGMLAGIGITIIAKQFHVMVDDQPPKDIIDGILSIPHAIWKGVAAAPPDFVQGVGAEAGGLGVAVSARLVPNHQEAAIIGLTSLLILICWKLLKPKAFKFIPSAVVAVLAAVLMNEFGRPLFEALGFAVGPAVDQHGGLGVRRVVVSSNLLDGLTYFAVDWPGWGILTSGLVLKAAFAFALIASAETLLCSNAVDGMHNGPRTRYDKELMAQGLGNTICGWLGALPMTGVIVRSSANVDAGAKTRMSAMLHGLWLLLFVSLLPDLLSRIPLAALAAVLVYTGWKLLNVYGLANLWKQSRGEALIFLVTAGTIVAEDLLAGVALGIVLSALQVLWMNSHIAIRRVDKPDEGVVEFHLDGAATFLRLPKLADAVESVPQGKTIIIDLDGVTVVDHAILTWITNFRRQYEDKGGKLILDWEQLQSRFNTPQMKRRERSLPSTISGNGQNHGTPESESKTNN